MIFGLVYTKKKVSDLNHFFLQLCQWNREHQTREFCGPLRGDRSHRMFFPQVLIVIHAQSLVFTENLDTFSLSWQKSKHRRTDRSVLCCLRKAETGRAWPRLTKDKTKV